LNNSTSILSKVDSDYNSDKIRVQEGLEPVRERPGWFMGGTGSKGLHQCVYEIVDNAVDEALAGYCTEIDVIVHLDNSVTVIDNGRGIPVDMHPEYGIPGVELVYTRLHTGAKFNDEGGAYKVAGGLHGVGAAAVNALSKRLRLRIKNGQKIYEISFDCGNVISPLTEVGETDESGTQVTFKPDMDVFEVEEFSYATLSNRFREMAYLNKGLKINLKDERSSKSDSFCYKGGLKEFITWLNRSKTPIHDTVYIFQSREKYEVEIAIQWTDSYSISLNSYANAISTTDGGTHVAGFKTAITRIINAYIKENNLLKGKAKLSGDDIREGLTAIISVKLPVLQFDSQIKTRLINSDVEGIVNSLAGDGLKAFFEENPKIAKSIVKKSLIAAAAREAARKARALTRKKSSFGGGMPGKMANCQEKNPELCEIYIVEGDSAGGTAKQARNRKYQAVLPLRGKILNVEKARYDKIFANNEIKMFVQALGAGVGKDNFDISKLRYHKVIIMTDADVDGSHIRTLILTLIYRQFPELIEKGYLYIAQPPLFKYKKGKLERYLKDEKALESFLITTSLDKSKVTSEDISISTSNIKKIIKKVISFDKRVNSYDACFDSPLLLEIIKAKLSSEMLKDKSKLQDKLNSIFGNLTGIDNRTYAFDIEDDIKNDSNLVHITVKTIARTKKFAIRSTFLDSPEVSDLQEIFESIKKFIDKPYSYKKDKVENEFAELSHFIDFILAEGKRGAYIQRYKGLGEMNAKQLWDTTMDPENRRLLQVQITDTTESDQVFSVLMGNKVEPRREFVEENALNVRNLDV